MKNVEHMGKVCFLIMQNFVQCVDILWLNMAITMYWTF